MEQLFLNYGKEHIREVLEQQAEGLEGSETNFNNGLNPRLHIVSQELPGAAPSKAAFG